jgi:hypothetical protein
MTRTRWGLVLLALALGTPAWAGPVPSTEPTALYYALSTIAQCAAALAALIGFFGLWRLDRLRDKKTQVFEAMIDIISVDSVRMSTLRRQDECAIVEHLRQIITAPQIGFDVSFKPKLEPIYARWDVLANTQQQLMDVLVNFLLGTLVVLALAIGLIPFAEALSTWVWPMRGLILVFGLWLGGAPAYVVLQAAGGVPVWQQVWSRVRHWHGPVLVAARLWDRWRHQPRKSPP